MMMTLTTTVPSIMHYTILFSVNRLTAEMKTLSESILAREIIEKVFTFIYNRYATLSTFLVSCVYEITFFWGSA